MNRIWMDGERLLAWMDRMQRLTWVDRLQLLLEWIILLFAATLCFSITVSWVVLIAGLVAWALVLSCRIARKETVLTKPPLLYPLVGMASIAFLIGAIHGGIKEAGYTLMTLRPMICYFWAHDAFARNHRLQAFSIALLLSLAAVAGFWSTIQQICNFHPFGFQYLQGTGFLSGPMAFAGQMQLFSMVAIALLMRSGYRWLPWKFKTPPVFAVVTAGNVLGVVFASERSAWLGFAVGLAVISLMVSRKLTAKLSAVAAVLCGLAWMFIPVFQTRLLPLLDWRHDVSTRARLIVWEKAWQVFLENPLFGCGVRNFPPVYIKEALVPGQADHLAHGHSNYLHILATTGICGFAVYIWLLFASFRLAWIQAHAVRVRNFLIGRALAFKRSIGLGMFGALVSLSVSGIFEYNFGTGQVRLAEWFLLAMLVTTKAPLLAQVKPVPEKATRSRPERKRKAA